MEKLKFFFLNFEFTTTQKKVSHDIVAKTITQGKVTQGRIIVIRTNVEYPKSNHCSNLLSFADWPPFQTLFRYYFSGPLSTAHDGRHHQLWTRGHGVASTGADPPRGKYVPHSVHSLAICRCYLFSQLQVVKNHS